MALATLTSDPEQAESRAGLGDAGTARGTGRPGARASTTAPITAMLSQPQSCPWTIASTRLAMAAASISAPCRSGSRLRPGARLSTSCARARTNAAIATGTLTRKTSRQFEAVISRPPSEGPRPAASAEMAEKIATAWARRSAGKESRTSAREHGTSMAPPTAWRTRKATSARRSGGCAQRRPQPKDQDAGEAASGAVQTRRRSSLPRPGMRRKRCCTRSAPMTRNWSSWT